MKIRTMPVLFIVAICLTSATFGQSNPKIKPGTSRGTRSTASGFPIGLNIPQHNDQTNNPDQKTLIVVAYCNATVGRKDLEGFVGQNAPLSLQQIVISTSGPERLGITFAVPYDYWYQVGVNHQPGNTPGVPTGGNCMATGWWS